MKTNLLYLAFVLFLFGCSSNKGEENSVKATTNTTFSIEGMTCAHGCAKSIETRIAGMKGVKECEVDFDNKFATVVYDDNKVSSEDFVSTIEKLNDHQYSVADLKTEKLSNSTLVDSESENNSSNSSIELPNILNYLKSIL